MFQKNQLSLYNFLCGNVHNAARYFMNETMVLSGKSCINDEICNDNLINLSVSVSGSWHVIIYRNIKRLLVLNAGTC